MLAGILIVVIVLIVMLLLFRNHADAPDESTPTSDAADANHAESDDFPASIKIPSIYDSPLMYRSTKGAISKMSDADRKAYRDAVEDLRKRLEEGPVLINDYAEAIIFEKHACVVLGKNLGKNGDPSKARIAAMNLFYFLVCMAAGFTADSISYDIDWYKNHSIAMLNITYFKVGRICGKRGDQDLTEIWALEYDRIAQALDPEGLVTKTTDWRKIRELVEDI